MSPYLLVWLPVTWPQRRKYRVNRKQWYLTEQMLSSSFNCLSKTSQDPLVCKVTITFAVLNFLK